MRTEIISASPEGLKGVAEFRAMLAGQPDDADTDLAVRRARLAAFAIAAAAPTGVTITDKLLGNVRVLQIDPPNWQGQAVFLHGGAYVLGSADTHLRTAAKYALASGARVLSVDYRLAPEHPYPAALNDALEVWNEVGELMPSAVIGDSAGGGLALALSVEILRKRLPVSAAVALISPWADLTLTNDSIDAMATAEIMLSKRGLEKDAERYRGSIDASDPVVSPALADLHGMPPVLIQVGTDEILFDDARLVADRIDAAAGNVHLQIWDGMTHAWPAYGDAVPEAGASIQAVGSFCRKWLSHKE